MADSEDERWASGKLRHRELSAAAAEHYDELYAFSNFATGSYMRYEVETIEKAVKQAPGNTIALDLGCGTGRDAFVLAKHFDHVYGYDFSPEMIAVATRRKLAESHGNVSFEVRDIEDGLLPCGPESISLVNTAFGMGSFVRDLPVLFREVRRVLLPRGIAIFSFYNSQSLSTHLKLGWTPALAARVAPDKEELHVEFSGKKFEIAAKAYSVHDVTRALAKNFSVVEITTFPTLSALFPQSLFSDERARELCTSVDYNLAPNSDLAAGPYIVAMCRKSGQPMKERAILGYERVLQALSLHKIAEDIREHQPVRTMIEVKEVLNAPEDSMVKSILVAVDEGSIAPEKSRLEAFGSDLYLVGIPADRNLHFGKLARVLGCNRDHVRAATQVELEERTGFAIGSIPPFGLPRDIPVILDERLLRQPVVWCGTGKASESLRVKIEDLKRLSMAAFFDVSKASVASGND